MFRICVCILPLLLLEVDITVCKKYGGRSRPSYRPSYSRPSPSYHPPASYPSYHPPASRPSYHPPAHNPSPPAYSPPSHRISPPATHRPAYGGGTVRPLGFDLPKSNPVGTLKHNTPVTGNLAQARPSYPSHRPSPSYHPPASHPSYHPPAHNPSPPAYSPPSHGSSVPGYHPPTHGSGTQRPLGFDLPNSHPAGPIGPPKHNTPVASAPPQGSHQPSHVGQPSQGSGTVRPIGFVTPSHSGQPSQGTGTVRPLGFAPPNQPGHPVGPPSQNNPLGNQGSAPHPAGYGPPPAYNPAGYGAPPAYSYHPPGGYQPNYHPGGYQPGYHPGSYQPGYHPGGGGGVTIINNNVHSSHGGWAPSYPTYHYTTTDTGSSTLGFFLGYSLGKLSTPSYHYHNSYYDGYTPRYDHYEVHHYYHNRDNVPKQADIQSNAIVSCVGDSGAFCPANTTSLCTNNGAVMCVASAISTVPCSYNSPTNCVKSTVPCVNNTSPECKQSNQKSASLTIPCISTAKVFGNVEFVNNSIIVSNVTTSNSSNSIIDPNGATSKSNVTSNVSNTPVTTTEVNTNTTTIPTPLVTTSTSTNPTVSNEKKEPQTFCVTILALPAERKLTEGEKLFSQTKTIFAKFAVKALGIE